MFERVVCLSLMMNWRWKCRLESSCCDFCLAVENHPVVCFTVKKRGQVVVFGTSPEHLKTVFMPRVCWSLNCGFKCQSSLLYSRHKHTCTVFGCEGTSSLSISYFRNELRFLKIIQKTSSGVGFLFEEIAPISLKDEKASVTDDSWMATMACSRWTVHL